MIELRRLIQSPDYLFGRDELRAFCARRVRGVGSQLADINSNQTWPNRRLKSKGKEGSPLSLAQTTGK